MKIIYFPFRIFFNIKLKMFKDNVLKNMGIFGSGICNGNNIENNSKRK